MPINVSGVGLAEIVQGFLQGLRLSTKRRNAVRYEVVRNHKFEDIALTEPTKCSQCHDTIWSLVGKRCKFCKLTSHKKCLGIINSICTKSCGDNNTNDNNGITSNSNNHQFKPKFFKTLTWCHHCGVLIKLDFPAVWAPQGLECSNCEMAVHYGCKQLVCQNLCCQIPAKNVLEIESSSTKRQPTIYSWQSQKVSIKDFEIIGLLGEGSFSKVYQAKLKQSQGNEEFAIKVIKKTNPLVNSDPESILTEMRVLNLAKHHPFLTLVHCCFQSEGRLFFVMEHVIGRDLVYHVTKSKKFTEDRARFYLAEIVLALIFLHANGFVYRDLKLDNVILDQCGHCKLIDFGMSKELTYQYKTTRTFCGTPNYISPEVIREQEYSFSVDWWALGVLMFEMLFGYSPFEAPDDESLYRSIVEDEVQIPPESLSREAFSMLNELLIKDPKTRLGCRERGEQDILDHEFFQFRTADNPRTYRWELIRSQRIKPPYVPTREDMERLGHDQEDLRLEPVSPSKLQKVPQDEFAQFSYYSDYFKTIARLN